MTAGYRIYIKKVSMSKGSNSQTLRSQKTVINFRYELLIPKADYLIAL